jgi:hypothetical protein
MPSYTYDPHNPVPIAERKRRVLEILGGDGWNRLNEAELAIAAGLTRNQLVTAVKHLAAEGKAVKDDGMWELITQPKG